MNNHISETIQKHIQNSDLSLAFRMLTDLVFDYKKPELYKKIIELCEWQHFEERSDIEVSNKYTRFLVELNNRETFLSSSTSSLLVSCKNLNKVYNKGGFKLNSINLEVHSGDIIGLVGENGNGKTTLLRILAQDLYYNSGEIDYFFSQEKNRYDLRTRLIYLPQRTPKWYGSLKDNLKYAASHYGIHGELNELMVLMYIVRFGLWKYRNHKWDELSSGYKMRFELARTFLRSPKLLLLDEPLANLDILSQHLILEDLSMMSKSKSNPIGIVLSSQQLFEVEKFSTQVVFLKQGVPTYLNNANEKEIATTIFELESNNSKLEILESLKSFNEPRIDFNGGQYLVSINEKNVFQKLLLQLIQSNIDIKYIRDVSKSSRRFFTK